MDVDVDVLESVGYEQGGEDALVSVTDEDVKEMEKDMEHDLLAQQVIGDKLYSFNDGNDGGGSKDGSEGVVES